MRRKKEGKKKYIEVFLTLEQIGEMTYDGGEPPSIVEDMGNGTLRCRVAVYTPGEADRSLFDLPSDGDVSEMGGC